MFHNYSPLMLLSSFVYVITSLNYLTFFTVVPNANCIALPNKKLNSDLAGPTSLTHPTIQSQHDASLTIEQDHNVTNVFSHKRNWVPRPSLFGGVEVPSEGPYSLSFLQDKNIQWIFGDTDHHFNISLSTCLQSNDVVGRYRFADGHVENGVTRRRIHQDLGFGRGGASLERYAARTIDNAQATLNSLEVLLSDSIICGYKNDLAAFSTFNRGLLQQHQGRNVAWVGRGTASLILGALGVTLGAGHWHFGVKIGLGALLILLEIIVIGLINLAQDRGYLAGPEAGIAQVFLAVVNALSFQASQSSTISGPCVPETELTSTVEQVGSYSNSDLGVTALDNEGFGLDCPAY